MIDNWPALIQLHADHAHWLIFFGALLAGLNIPVSIDLLMILGATLAATVIPSHLPHLFLAIFLGCLLSAWISYWFGRLLLPHLAKWPFFAKLVQGKRMARVKNFYEKRGFLALLFGRFVPFGVRNLLFMSKGLSKTSFFKFALRDSFACFFWSLSCFSLYYTLGKNFDRLVHGVKLANILIFFAFGVTVIGIIWYKKRKNTKEENVQSI